MYVDIVDGGALCQRRVPVDFETIADQLVLLEDLLDRRVARNLYGDGGFLQRDLSRSEVSRYRASGF